MLSVTGNDPEWYLPPGGRANELALLIIENNLLFPVWPIRRQGIYDEDKESQHCSAVDREEEGASLLVCVWDEYIHEKPPAFIFFLFFTIPSFFSFLCSFHSPPFPPPQALISPSLPLLFMLSLPPSLWPVVGLSVQCSPTVGLGWLSTLPLITAQRLFIYLAVKWNWGHNIL